MTKSESLKPEECQERSNRSAYSNWEYVLWTLICAADPERKRGRKTDINWAKYQARKLASSVASRGPKWLNEATNALVYPQQRINQISEFASELGSMDEWRRSSCTISVLSSTLIELMSSTDKDDALLPDMFETLGILAYVQGRIAQVIESA